jgi:hypothetical protein
MASKANALDPKVIAAKKKKQAIVLGVLFLAVLAFQGPRTLKMLNRPSPTAAPAAPAPVTPAATTPGAPVATAGGTTGQTISASVGADSLVVNADLQPAPLEGQLPDLTSFSTKDPFLPQGGDKNTVAAPSTSGKSGKSGKAATSGSTGADKASGGGTGETGSGGGVTPSKPSLPAAPTPTSAVLSVNGVQETVNVNGDFPASSPLFHLISLKAKSAKISIAGGSLATGAPAVTIQIGKPTTLMNTADGTRFVIVLVSTGESTPATPATTP